MKTSNRFIKIIYKRLIMPQSDNEDDRRRELIFNVLLLSVIVLIGSGLLLDNN